MSGVLYRLRADLRASWRGAAGLVVLVALLGGAVLASTAGARRTASAYPRMLEHTDFPALIVSPPGGPGLDPNPFYEEIDALPEVVDLGVVAGIPAFPLAGSPTEELASRLAEDGPSLTSFLAPIDETFGRSLARPIVWDGRLPDPTRSDEVFASGALARRGGLRVGDRLDLVLVPRDEDVRAFERTDGVPLSVTVVGVGIFPEEVVPFSDLDEHGLLLFTPPVARLLPRSEWDFEGAMVDLARSADPAEVAAAIETLGAASEHTGGPVFLQDRTASASKVQDGLRPLAVALALFAAVLAVVSIMIIGQALARHTHRTPRENEALAALGFTARQRGLVSLARSAVIGVVGAALAAAGAFAVSGRFPIGPARLADPDPGLRADVGVLVLGGLAIVLALAAVALPAVVLRGRGRAGHVMRTTWPSRAGVAAGLPAPAAQGLRFALDRNDQSGASTSRSTLVAATMAVAFVLAAAVFATSLSNLIESPHRYGQRWDRFVDNQFSPVPSGMLVDELRDDPAVAGMSAGSYLDVTIDGEAIPGVTMVTVAGTTGLTAVRGRPAQAPGEIALGGAVLDRLDVTIGDTVEVDAGDGARPARVVGEVVFPRFNQGSFGQTGLGEGAQIHPDDAPSAFLDPTEGPLPEGFTLDDRLHNFLAVEIEEGASAEAITRLDERLSEFVEAELVLTVRDRQPPTTISDLARVRDLPLALAGVLVVAAVAVLSHLLLSAVRSRRRELALLACVGFTGGQLRASVRWHASLVAGVAVLAGAPIGVALGRQAWTTFAGSIHVGDTASLPWWWLVWTLPAALIIANLAAAVPARRARRIPPAVVLRQE